ncbi:MAG TPA: cell division protein FtsA [Vitreimonas sp.]|nr:cell division protein FtsA [Vitreimonas sp.]
MARSIPITAIDIGTDKCVTLIAVLDDETRQLRVVGASVVASRGLRKSTIVDLEQVLETITESLDGAERMAGFDVKSAFISVSGSHIASQNSKGVVAVAAPNQEIMREDVSRVIEAARAISLPSDREIVHVVPRHFKVDSQDGIKDPVGMTGVRLEAEAHIITSMSTALRNLEKSIRDVGLEVDGFVFAGLAAADVVVTETEKELGVVVVDIGAGSTALCAFVEGSLAYSAVLPIGARHITQDIALGCRVSLEAAEKIKVALSTETLDTVTPYPGESKEDLNKRRKKADVLEVGKLGIEESVEVLSKRAIVEGIMVPRMKEIFTMIAQQLNSHDLLPLVPAGVVLSGGGAETIGIAEVAKRTLNLPARVGRPLELQGLVHDIQKPSFATAIGLLMYGKYRGGSHASGHTLKIPNIFKDINIGGIANSLGKFFKSLMP